MPNVPGITLLPNSAPDSFTPKNLNFVRFPEHTPLPELEGAGALDVVLAGVVGWAEVVVAVPGWHWK